MPHDVRPEASPLHDGETARALLPLTRFLALEWTRRARIDHGILQCLQEMLGAHVRAGRLNLCAHQEVLLLACRDPILATELRFQQRELLKVLHAAGHGQIRSVRTFIATAGLEIAHHPAEVGTGTGGGAVRGDGGRTTVRVERPLPESARQALLNTAAHLRDPGLQAILRRFAGLGRH